MSHKGKQRLGLRAFCVIASACALVFALLVSGAPHRLSPTAASGQTMVGVDARGLCHDDVTDAKSKAPDHPMKKGANCPCCLAAHSAPAVLPDRVFVAVRLEPAPSPAVYRPFVALRPPFVLSETVNGARAPPSRRA